ncbi:hypothetical protein SGRIM128S_09022 [Streptomyces griseomycini]
MSEPLYRPWGTVTPEFWGAPAPGAAAAPSGLAPETLRARLVKVAEVARTGHLPDAAALAARLDQDVTAEYGELHLHTVQVREVRGYLAALAGTPRAVLVPAPRTRVDHPGHPGTRRRTEAERD